MTTLDNDIHDSSCALHVNHYASFSRRNYSCSIHGLKYKSIHGLLTWLHDNPLPENKARVRMDGRTDGRTENHQVIAITLCLRFVMSVKNEETSRNCGARIF